jgi:ubiquitin carboxyl-terminal hydrolase 36/42
LDLLFCNFNLVLHGATSIFHRDEEYDRGKRKKLRQSQHNFDGPNLFQALATKNTQVKKAKMDRSRSENQPFRI